MISICIPTYEQRGEGAKMLSVLLMSIATQTFSDPFEVVISDNATDGSIKKVVEGFKFTYPRLVIGYHFNPVRGVSENINNSIDLARYDKIKLMMQDDYFAHPMALKYFSDALDHSGWVMSDSRHVNAEGTKIGERRANYYPENFDTNTVGMPSVIAFRKSDIRFDARLSTFCDVYFYYQLYQKFSYPGHIPHKIIAQRYHNASQSRNQPGSHVKDKNFLIRQGLIPGELPRVVVAVVVYNRFDNMDHWVRVWQQCDTAGAQLVIIHNIDSNQFHYENEPDYNIKVMARHNVGYDIGAFQDVCRQRLPGFPDYDYLLWCTDDTIPMSKNFIWDFIDKFDPKTGCVCMQISTEVTRHVRTTGFCIPKKIATGLRFAYDPITTRQQCLFFEHRGNSWTLYNQIIAKHRKITQVAPLESSPLYDMGFWYRNEEAKKQAAEKDRMTEHYKIFPILSNEKVTE